MESSQNTLPPRKERSSLMTIIPSNAICPRCFSKVLYRFGKDKEGFQKYQCKRCKRQFAPDNPLSNSRARHQRKYPACPICGKATFLHHDHTYYSNFRCCDKKCNHSFHVPKLIDVQPPSSELEPQSFSFKGMRHSLHTVLCALNYYFCPNRDSSAAHSLLSNCRKKFGQPRSAIISDRYYAYQQPASLFFPQARHVRVEDFDDVVNNNVIEAFNGQFKAWYKPKRGFNSYESANRLIATYIFFYNFIRPHSSLNGLTPAQVAGAKCSEREQLFWFLVA
jgi:hypothetical protein